MSEYSIFKPKTSRGIFTDYPELRRVDAFSKLNDEEMLFVWYYACESSPYYETESDRERVSKSLSNSFKKVSEKDKEDMMGGKFSSKMASAISEMKKYKVGPRARANKIIEKGFKNMETILNIDAGDASMFLNKDDEVDFAKKRAYVDTLAKATDLMPKLIEQLEGRYSLHEDKDENSTFEGSSFIDSYHENSGT